MRTLTTPTITTSARRGAPSLDTFAPAAGIDAATAEHTLQAAPAAPAAQAAQAAPAAPVRVGVQPAATLRWIVDVRNGSLRALWAAGPCCD